MRRNPVSQPTASAASRPHRPAHLWLLAGALGIAGLSAVQTGRAISAQAAAPVQLGRASQPEVRFNFRVTLIPVPGSVNDLKAQLTTDFEHLSATRGTVKANLAALSTGIRLRDTHARNYLGADKYPQAIFDLKTFSGPERIRDGQTVQGQVSGNLTLNGVTRPLNAPITLKREGRQLSVQTAFDVVLADHAIKIPGADPRVDTKVSFTVGT
jgi:polyisoprenoid-binding protein YceI